MPCTQEKPVAWTEEDDKRALHMRDVEGLGYAEIARRMKRSKASIKSHFRTIRSRARTGKTAQARSVVEQQRRDLFISMWEDGEPIEAIMAALDMKRASVLTRRSELGLAPREDASQPAMDPATDYRAMLAAEWRARGMDDAGAELRAGLFTAYGAARELSLLRKGMNA